MNGLNEVRLDFDFYHCVEREGFKFTSVTEPANILDAIVIRNPENCDCWCPKKSFSEKTLEEHIAVINKYGLEKACIIAEDISFIKQCPSLKYLAVFPAGTAPDNFDYSPLYDMPNIVELHCSTQYGGMTEHLTTSVDYERVSGLERIHAYGQGHLNYDKVTTLKRVHISHEVKKEDFQDMCINSSIEEMEIVNCKLKSLKGIKSLTNLNSLTLEYMRSLKDVSNLNEIGPSINALLIENCPKINDFSFLHNLPNIEYLALYGNNNLDNLLFLDKMPNLKTFVFSMNVLDCDLTPCLKVPYVDSLKNRKGYNLKNKDLPKSLDA